MKSGKTVLNTITSTRNSLANQVCAIDGQISATEREIGRQNEIRSNAITRLAEMFADNGGELAKQFKTINTRVQSLFDEKTKRREALNKELADLEKNDVMLAGLIKNAKESVGESEDKIIEIRAGIAIALKDNVEYHKLQAEIVSLKELIAKDDARLQSLIADCNNRRTEYLADIYFSYLNDLKYGTPDYKPGLFPKMDKWLARVSHYNENAKKYELLGLIPDRVSGANEKRRVTVAQKIEARDRISDVVEKESGLVEQQAFLKAKKADVEKVMAALERNNKSQAQLRKEKEQLDSGNDPFQRKAKEELKALFNSTSIAQLRQQAEITHTQEDDGLVDILEHAEKAINEQRHAAKDLIKQRKPLEEQLTKIKEAEYRFSHSGYDDTHSRFNDSLDVNGLLLGYMAGSITQSAFDRTLTSAHRAEPPAPSYSSYSSRSSSDDDSYRRRSSDDSSSRSSSSSSNSDYSSSSSSSSSDYSSGGSFDSGGGFSSGGDF